jgi:hypothetical protein
MLVMHYINTSSIHHHLSVSDSTKVKISSERIYTDLYCFATKTNWVERFHGDFEECIHSISFAAVLQWCSPLKAKGTHYIVTEYIVIYRTRLNLLYCSTNIIFYKYMHSLSVFKCFNIRFNYHSQTVRRSIHNITHSTVTSISKNEK